MGSHSIPGRKKAQRKRVCGSGEQNPAGGGHTRLNEVLEDPGELRVLVDVEEVGVSLRQLSFLGEHKEGSPGTPGSCTALTA